MDYRKSYNTPRERVDDDMLLNILEENEPIACAYGNSCRRSNRCGNVSVRISPRQEQNNPDNCCNDNCAKQNCLSGYAIAMVYSPDQEWRELYCDDDAMSHGTMFSELYKPFYHGCTGSCR